MWPHSVINVDIAITDKLNYTADKIKVAKREAEFFEEVSYPYFLCSDMCTALWRIKNKECASELLP